MAEPFLPEVDDPTFARRCSGATAGISSAVFYTCQACGSAIIEMEYGTGPDGARRLHVLWHRAQPTPSGPGDPR